MLAKYNGKENYVLILFICLINVLSIAYRAMTELDFFEKGA